MAVCLQAPEQMHPVQGITLATVAAGLKKNGGDDLVLIACSEGTKAAAVFTQNAFCAAPVTIARRHLASTSPRYLLINAGNANAGTGTEGLNNTIACCEYIASRFSVATQAVLPFSTGVIGEQLDMSIVQAGMEKLPGSLSEDNWSEAANAILTTDTVAKGFSETLVIDGKTVTVTGFCKGSGMICPNMATMLAYIATDAEINSASLNRLLKGANEKSFNSITVDGDTSTNDACVLLATGRAENRELSENHPQWREFSNCIENACKTLAQAIIRDGEGATKFIEVNVKEGADHDDCRQIAYTIAHSPLVKTAFFASDPNVGRLLAAVGRAGVRELDIRKVSIAINAVAIVENGEPAVSYTEARGQSVMNKEEITVHVKMGRGNAQWSIWTTDLSYDYVKINAEYRT